MDNQYFNNAYNQNTNPSSDPFQGERKGLTTASFICGIASIPMSYFTGLFGCMLGLMAIFFGIFSKGTAKIRSSKAVGGIITGAIGFVFGLGLFIISIYYVSTHYEELLSSYEEIFSMLEGYQDFLNRN